MTTRTMRETITITNSTSTAAATVSSERRAGGQERDTVENFLSYSGAESGDEEVEPDWDCLTAGREEPRLHGSL